MAQTSAAKPDPQQDALSRPPGASSASNDVSPLRRGPMLFVLLLLLAGMAGLVARIAHLAGGHAKGPAGQDLRAIYEQQHTSVIQIPARRGNMYDCRGRLLAGSVLVPSVYADPALVADADATAAALGGVLNMPAAEIATMISARSQRRFAWISRGVSEQQAEAVRKLRLHGVGILREPDRCYPMGSLAGHVLGFTGADHQGLAGVELRYDKDLRGRDGLRTCTKDAAGRILGLAPNGYQPARDGCNLMLSIDGFVQSVAEQALQETVAKYEAEGGVAIVLEPSTGQVLALASNPAFDPNYFRDAPESALRNRAVTGPVEPGSTFKPMVASAALAEGRVRPGEIIFCHNGLYVAGRRLLRDHHPYDNLTFEQVIAKSSNIGMAILGERIGNATMWHYLTRFGFGHQTGIDLPGEDAGILLPLAKWTRYSTNSVPMGQEVAVTPLQLLGGFNTLVNGGQRVRPTITRVMTDPDGRIVMDHSKGQVVGQAIEPAVAKYMAQVILKMVVNEGTGSRARLDRWQVIGKTGTAQIARHGGGGYEPDAYVSSFLCAAPASQPRASVLVMVFRPNRRKGYYGGTVAAPAAGKILAATLDYLGVPDDPEVPDQLGAMLASSPAGD